MCGIVGIVRGGEAGVRGFEALGVMAKTLAHRGPDNTGTYVAGRIGVGHTRLALLDLSARGNQPFRSDRYSLVYNGEIYNFQALRRELEAEFNIDFASGSDTEVLFQSLVHRGTDKTLASIRGMFAFAFVDHAEAKVVLVRDRIGIKPLFYASVGGDFYFASELKALREVLDLTPDKHAVVHAISGSLERAREITAFAEVRQLAPGAYLTIDASKATLIQTQNRYFHTADLVDADLYRELDAMPLVAVLDRFEKLFAASVESMLIADAPVGAFVSGGVDSSLISTTAKLAGKNPHLYSVDVAGRLSEIAAARDLAAHLGAELEVYTFAPEHFLRDWVKTTYAYENPIVANPHAIPFGSIAAAARRGGEKAVLTGEGADELFVGYWIDARRSWMDPWLHAPLRFLERKLAALPWSTLPSISGWKSEGDELEDLFRRQDETLRNAEYHDALGFIESPRRRSQQEITLRLLDGTLQALLWRNDRMGMMHSIESRFPFLDEPILSFGASLPARFKVARSWRRGERAHPFLVNKYLVRKLAERQLPRELARRRKRPFPIHGLDALTVGPDLFDDGFLQQLLGVDRAQARRFPETLSPGVVARMASVEVWGRLYVAREGADRVQTRVENSCTLRVPD